MFVHFGLYAIPARGEWVMNSSRIRIRDYEALMRVFRPTRQGPLQWARLAREAGMRYMVLTTKHHDGFCLFDTKWTTYNAVRSAAGRDLVRDYADACRAEGLHVGFYYSIMDWHHPNYPLPPNHPLCRLDPMTRRPDKDRYARYMLGQLKELLTNYGQVDVLWFDGRNPAFDGAAIANELRKLQPNLLINNRLEGTGFTPDFVTPEQSLPRTPSLFNGQPVAWEACHTMTGQSWGYSRYETAADFRPASALIRMLVRAVACGGNFLLNVGPRPDGSLRPEEVARLKAIGRWMRRYGESIYGTEAGPMGDWVPGCLTRKGQRVFAHVFDLPKNGRLSLPDLQPAPVSAGLLGGKNLAMTRNQVAIPHAAPDTTDAVLVLDYPKMPFVPLKPVRRVSVSAVDYRVVRGRPVAVNGWMDEAVWGSVPALEISQDTHYDESQGRYPASFRHGYCAYRLRAMHAAGVLYLAVEVESPTCIGGTEPVDMYHFDAVRLLFAANPKREQLNFTPESFEISVDAGGRAWMPDEDKMPGAMFRHGVRRTAKGYTVMVAVPLSFLRKRADDPRTGLRSGDRFRFNVLVSQPSPWMTFEDADMREKKRPWWERHPDHDFTPYGPRHRVFWKGSDGDNPMFHVPCWGVLALA